ncbi:uncharacterized protein LOC135165435 [Diachasmimorpha longicaudata]|uniref:uncharacterized protein LOC135165435 n=1 Tax=Diachasmimorpha longicaudata TaxID=58733 RepID=UPI0030B8F639
MKKNEQQLSQGRLRLKTSTRSKSSSKPSHSPVAMDRSRSFDSLHDESLADFKSPKPSKIFSKSSGQIANTKNEPSTSKNPRHVRSKKPPSNQQSIVSLFAKTEAENSTFTCPVCLKPFSCPDIQVMHTKKCAAQNGISTETLVAAMELQEKQSNERKAMGLPSKGLPTPKRKPSSSRSAPHEDDPDIQLALALSKSLNEAQELEKLDEAIALAADEDDTIPEMTASQRRSTLMSFGFSTNKPTGEVERPRRRKKLQGPTVLQTRTPEVKEQILTERIAEVLVGSESITQLQEVGIIVRAVIIIKQNSELRMMGWDESARLWRLSFGNGDGQYYVEALKNIMGIVDDGTGKDCLMIIADRQHSNKGATTKSDIEEVKDYSTIEETGTQPDLQNTCEVHQQIDTTENETSNTDEIAEAIIYHSSQTCYKECENMSPIEKSESEINSVDSDNIMSLSNDWSKMVAGSYLSDIAIFIKDSTFIHAHKLVFWTRCHTLITDLEICNVEDKNDRKCYPIKNKIHWPNIDHDAALVFLKYIYSGKIAREDLKGNNILEQVISLGKKYKVAELLKIVENSEKKRSDESKRNTSTLNAFEQLKKVKEDSTGIKNTKNIEKKSSFSESMHNSIDTKNNSVPTVIELDSSLDGSITEEGHLTDEKVMKKTERSLNRRHNTTSPDLFDDSEMFHDVPESALESPHHPIMSDVLKSISASDRNPEPKQKSDLSVFINNIERRQARNVLESDTDGDTPVRAANERRRNPFRVGARSFDDSELWSKNTSSKARKSSEDRAGALSMLENAARARSVDDVGKSVDVADNNSLETTEALENEDDSIYSKYMKLGRENSIEKYRKAVIAESTPKSSDSRRKYWEKSPGVDIKIKGRGEITKDECSQFRSSKVAGNQDKNGSEEAQLPGNLEFDTWDGSSSSTGSLFSQRIDRENISTNRKRKGDANNSGEAVRGSKKLSFKSTHFLRTDNADLPEPLGKGDTSQKTPRKNRAPSLIVLSSSDDEMTPLMENRSQRPDRSWKSEKSSAGLPERSPDENLNYSHDVHSLNTPTPRRKKTLSKTPLKDKTQNLNNHPSSSENRLKRFRELASIRISHNVTPPLDYSRMNTPELHDELKKYGLKCHTRTNGIQLLEHIYEETHPLVPLECIPPESSPTEKEEPAPKKRHLNPKNLPKRKIVSEEMCSQEVEQSDCPAGALSVSQAFRQLLASDTELHKKVLTYEPLLLETLYKRLKAEGCAGNMNEVMDFLDNQCITFQTQVQRKHKKVTDGGNTKTGGK